MNDTPKYYNWTRYWVPRGTPFACGHSGNWFFSPGFGKTECKTSELLNYKKLAVLLGDPGSGKSTEFQILTKAATASHTQVLSRRAAELGGSPSTSIPQTSQWKKHTKKGHDLALMIDGIDEVLVSHPHFIDEIIGLVKGASIHKLTVVLSLRAGSWDSSYEKELLNAFKADAKDAVYEICYLSQEDAALAYTQRTNQKHDEFFKWVHDRELGSLARLPIYIDQLIDDFRDHPSNTFSIHDLRLRTVERLLLPASMRESQTTNLNADQLLSLASLIAVHTILSGHADFVFPSNQSDDQQPLNLTSLLNAPLSGKWYSGDIPFSYTESDLRALLSRPLFTTALQDGKTLRRFSHFTHSEALAARVLDRQPIERLLHVLGSSSLDRIPPQNENVAAMLATTSQNLRSWLLENQPLILLRSDATQFTDEEQAQIIKACLNYIDTAEENIRLSYSEIERGYKSDAVAIVLKDALTKEDERGLSRIAALDIAEKCPAPLLLDPAYAILINGSIDDHVRNAALDAWIAAAETLPEAPVETAFKIASGEVGTGKPHDRGDALLFLTNSGVALNQLLPITPARPSHHFGSLNTFLDSVAPTAMTLDDLDVAFDYIEKHGGSKYSGAEFSELAQAAYSLTLANLTNNKIRQLFVHHWWETHKQYYSSLNRRLVGQLKELNPKHRQLLISDLIHSADDFVKHVSFHIPVYKEDVQWLIENLPPLCSPARLTWVDVVSCNWRLVVEDKLPKWLVAAHENGADDFKSVFPSPKLGESLQDTISRLDIDAEAIRIKREKEQKKFRKRHKHYSRKKFIKNCTRGFQNGETNIWVHFAEYAHFSFQDDDRNAEYNSAHSITSSLSWKMLVPPIQESAKLAARKHLFEREVPYPRAGNSNWDVAAYKAIDLLRDELFVDQQLTEEIRQKWTQSIEPRFNNGEQNHQELMAILKRLDPARYHSQLKNKLPNALINRRWPLFLRAYQLAWGQRESVVLMDSIMQAICRHPVVPKRTNKKLRYYQSTERSKIECRRAESINSAFHFLADTDPVSAEKLVLSIVNRCSQPRVHPSSIEAAVLLHAALRFPALWSVIWQTISQIKPTHLRQGIMIFVQDLDRGYYTDNWTKPLQDNELIQLYKLYDRLYPQHPIHRRIGGDSTVTGKDQLVGFDINMRETMRARGMISAISSMSKSLVSEDRREAMLWNLKPAKDSVAEKSWSPPSCQEISSWLQNSHAMLVRSSDDLRRATMISLQRYQDHLAQENLVLDCWVKEPRRKGHPQDYRPSEEEDLSLRIAKFLQNDMKSIVISREGALRVAASENRTDLEVSVTSPQGTLTVIIEHKRAHNSEVSAAMETQLLDRYMTTKGCSQGVYLVSWFDGFANCSKSIKNKLGVSNPEEANGVLSAQALQLSIQSGSQIEAFVLKCA